MQRNPRLFSRYLDNKNNSLANSSSAKRWTFLIYMNGSDPIMDRNQREEIRYMEQAGSTDNLNVIVQRSSWSERSPEKEQTVRMRIEKSIDPHRITSPVLQNLGTIDMGDYKNLEDFIAWGIKEYPADHYLICVESHGYGWIDDINIKPFSRSITAGISPDRRTGNWMTVEELGKAMNYAATLIGHKVDIYVSYACLMNMAEVNTELAPSVDIVMGSEDRSFDPPGVIAFKKLLLSVKESPDATPLQVANTIMDGFIKLNQPYQGDFGTFSALDLTHYDSFLKSMKALADNMLTLNDEDRQKLRKAVDAAMDFENRAAYVDILDAIKQITNANIAGINQATLDNVVTSLNQLIIANATTKLSARATGLSIWFPTNANDEIYDIDHHAIDAYEKTKFNQETGWANALRYLIEGKQPDQASSPTFTR